MRTFTTAFNTAKDKVGNTPVTLIKIELLANGSNPAKTLRLADRRSSGQEINYVTPQNTWINIITDYELIDSNVSANDGNRASDPSARIEVANIESELFTPQARFSSIFNNYIPESAIVTISQFFEEVGFDENDMEDEHVGRIQTPIDFDEQYCSFDVVGLTNEYGKRRIGNLINKTDYPNAPEESVGKFINIPFGVIPSVPSIPIHNAAENILKAALTVGQTTMQVADTSKFPNSGTIIIDGDEISYTGKTSNTLTGISGQTQTHYNGDICIEKINAYPFLVSDPSYPIKSIDAVYGRVRDKNILIDESQYTKNVANGQVSFSERPFVFDKTLSEFLQAQFDAIGAGNTADDPLNVTDPDQPTATAKINQAKSILSLKQTTVMESLGEILSVKLFVAHYEDGLLPNDSLTVDIVGHGQVGVLSKPGTEETNGDISGNLDFKHGHLDDLDFIINEEPHFHGLENVGSPPVLTDEVISASITHNGGGADGIVNFNNSLGGFELRFSPVGSSGAGASLSTQILVNFPAIAGVSNIGSVTYNFTGVPGGGINLSLFTSNASFIGFIHVFLEIGGQSYLIYKSLFGQVPEVWLKSLTVTGSPASNTAKIRIQASINAFDQFSTAGWGLPYQQIVREVFETPISGTDTSTTGVENNKAGEVQEIDESRNIDVSGGSNITRGANDRFDISSIVNKDWSWFTNKEVQVKYNGVQDGVTSFVAHLAFEIEYVFQQKLYVTEVCADLQGLIDDGSGSITGTPNALIERPDYIFKWSLLKGLSLDSSIIDTASFNSAGSLLLNEISGGYKFAGAIQQKLEARSLWKQWSKESRCLFHIERGKAKIYFQPKNGIIQGTVYDVKQSDIVNIKNETDIKLERGREDDVINSIDLRYQVDLVTGDYNANENDSDSESISTYGKREKPEEFEFDWVRNQTQALNLCEFFLAEHKNIYTWCNFSTPLNLMQLERYDFITINHPLIGEIGLTFPCLILGPSRQLGHGVKKRPDLMRFTVRLDGTVITIIPPAEIYFAASGPTIELSGGLTVAVDPAEIIFEANTPNIVLGSALLLPPAAEFIIEAVDPIVNTDIPITVLPAEFILEATGPKFFLTGVLVKPEPAELILESSIGSVELSSINLSVPPAEFVIEVKDPVIIEGFTFDSHSGLFDDAPGLFDKTIVFNINPEPAEFYLEASGPTIVINDLFDDVSGNFDDKPGNFDDA